MKTVLLPQLYKINYQTFLTVSLDFIMHCASKTTNWAVLPKRIFLCYLNVFAKRVRSKPEEKQKQKQKQNKKNEIFFLSVSSGAGTARVKSLNSPVMSLSIKRR